MQHTLNLPTRPYEAIKNGTKKVEGRVPSNIPNKYQQMKPGDIIVITNEDNGEMLKVNVKFIRHYADVRTMLEAEGVENVLSSGGTIEEGIERYNLLTGYKQNLPKYGIYAIGVEMIL